MTISDVVLVFLLLPFLMFGFVGAATLAEFTTFIDNFGTMFLCMIGVGAIGLIGGWLAIIRRGRDQMKQGNYRNGWPEGYDDLGRKTWVDK